MRFELLLIIHFNGKDLFFKLENANYSMNNGTDKKDFNTLKGLYVSSKEPISAEFLQIFENQNLKISGRVELKDLHNASFKRIIKFDSAKILLAESMSNYDGSYSSIQILTDTLDVDGITINL